MLSKKSSLYFKVLELCTRVRLSIQLYLWAMNPNSCKVSQWVRLHSVWQSETLLPISCKLVQPVPARVQEQGNLLVVLSRTIYPFPRWPKPARESRLSKLVVSMYQRVFRRRRRTRSTTCYLEAVGFHAFYATFSLLFLSNELEFWPSPRQNVPNFELFVGFSRGYARFFDFDQ